MNTAVLSAKVEEAKRRLLAAETVMERSLQQIKLDELQEKSIISAALSSALAELKAARQNLLALEQAISEP
jgi:hypothetical protein